MADHPAGRTDPDPRPVWAQAHPAAAFATTITDEASPFNLTAALYMREVVVHGYRAVRSASWITPARDLRALPDATYYGSHDDGQEEVLLQPDERSIARAQLSGGRVSVIVAADSQQLADSVLADLRQRLPRAVLDPQAPKAPITFWSLTANGPVGRTRMIDVPGWADVAGHYVEATRDPLEGLMDGFRPGLGGQLMLWQGLPGTGKTWALRALAWEWRAWCDFHYITDPETFFGDHAAYMLDVLLHGDDAPVSDDPDDPNAAALDARARDGRWRLLVLEDTGELMAADARERSGQGLSRLLNVVDGLIGQGLRILVLVTTNEELRSLHPAVRRAGRCASRIAFHGFPEDEAQDWLIARDVEPDQARELAADGVSTIADLFAALEDRRSGDDRARVGFAA